VYCCPGSMLPVGCVEFRLQAFEFHFFIIFFLSKLTPCLFSSDCFSAITFSFVPFIMRRKSLFVLFPRCVWPFPPGFGYCAERSSPPTDRGLWFGLSFWPWFICGAILPLYRPRIDPFGGSGILEERKNGVSSWFHP